MECTFIRTNLANIFYALGSLIKFLKIEKYFLDEAL